MITMGESARTVQINKETLDIINASKHPYLLKKTPSEMRGRVKTSSM